MRGGDEDAIYPFLTLTLHPPSPSCCFPQPLPFLLPHTSDVVSPWSISLCSVKEGSDSDGIALVSVHLPVFWLPAWHWRRGACHWYCFGPVRAESEHLIHNTKTSLGHSGSCDASSALVWLPLNGAGDRHTAIDCNGKWRLALTSLG